MSVNWDRFQAVNEATDGSWPEKGKELVERDSIEGRYVSKKENVGPNKSTIYVLETPDGKKIGVWGSTVIDSKFENIAVGKMVAIEYVGDKKGKTGSEYHDFKVGTGIDHVGDQPPF